MKTFIFGLVTGLLFLTSTCEKNDQDLLEITGTIEKQEITSYQYGSHTLEAEDEFYALRSEKVNLDEFIGNKVTIFAQKIKGYPVDGGPDFLEVEKVKK